MVVGAFPIAKLSVLLIKQISKPIANWCKESAKSSPFFRTYVCMPPAQFYNWCEVKAKMWILNLGKPVNIPVLSQEMAIDLGANLLGESVIFVIGAGLLIIEYNRQSKKETAKEAKRIEEMQNIMTTLTDLYFTVQHQETKLREIERMVLGGDKKIPSEPPTKPPTPPPSLGIDLKQKTDPQTANNNLKTNEECIVKSSSTPFPDKGIILKSLNYIQMDAFSSLFCNNNEKEIRQQEDVKKSLFIQKSDIAIITEALNSIEKNFKSLF